MICLLCTQLLRDGHEEWVPFDTSRYCSASAFDAASPIFHEVVNSLEFLNIDVEQVTRELTFFMFMFRNI